MIEILNRYTGAVLYSSASAQTIAEAVHEAAAKGARLVDASLDGARLDRATLDGASLVGASLDGARLDGASLVGARLDRASLVGARLDRASLDGHEIRAILQIGGSRNWIVASACEGVVHVGIGCHQRTLDKWLATYEEIGPDNSYTPAQVAEYGEHLRYIERWAAAL